MLLAPGGDRERIASAIPTVQWLGYATGAAYVGIVVNAAGFAEAAEPAEIADAALAVFAASLVFAAIGLAATGRFVFSRLEVPDGLRAPATIRATQTTQAND